MARWTGLVSLAAGRILVDGSEAGVAINRGLPRFSGPIFRHNNPQAIAVKECMVTSVDSLTGKGTQEISANESERLTRYLKLYDQVAALFAPFERPTSSGYRLRVTIADKYGVTF